ncbi:uncharacterized protein LOC144477610 [Augochlora pura]
MSRYLVSLILLLIMVLHAHAQAPASDSPREGNCSVNEEYSSCGKLCEPTCTNSDRRSSVLCTILNGFSWLCVPQVTGGCRCMPGFTRNDSLSCVNCDSSKIQ